MDRVRSVECGHVCAHEAQGYLVHWHELVGFAWDSASNRIGGEIS